MKVGYVWRANDGDLALTRCPRCSRENYLMAVMSGVCAWCAYVAQESDLGVRGTRPGLTGDDSWARGHKERAKSGHCGSDHCGFCNG